MRMRGGVFLGAGLFVGTLNNTESFLYCGGMVRVRRQDLPDRRDSDEKHHALKCGIDQILAQLAELEALGTYELVEDAPLELTGCCEADTGDWLVLWRVACFECVTH